MKSSADNYQPSGRQLSTVWPTTINRSVDNYQHEFCCREKAVLAGVIKIILRKNCINRKYRIELF